MKASDVVEGKEPHEEEFRREVRKHFRERIDDRIGLDASVDVEILAGSFPDETLEKLLRHISEKRRLYYHIVVARGIAEEELQGALQRYKDDPEKKKLIQVIAPP